MSLIIFLFILAVIIALFSFTGQKPQSVPPVFPPVIAPLPEPEYVPTPGEVTPVVDPVPATEICPVSEEVESAPVEVELFPISQSQLEACLSSETTYPTLDAVVADEFKTDETQAPKKKHYYYKPKSKK
jgi:hypothetical protein